MRMSSQQREKGLTVAIPTMRRWNFLKSQLPGFLNHPRISYVVICDETGEDAEAIAEHGMDMHPKMRLYVNESILGVYGNKRQCIEKAPTEWVAVLDSDNLFTSSFFDAFWAAVERESLLASKMLFCAGQQVRLFDDTGKTEERIGHLSGIKLSRGNWNSVLAQRDAIFLLNDGNTIWPTSVLRHLPPMPESEIVGTDSIFALRQVLLAGYTLSVEPEMRYVHLVHSGSHWIQHETESTRLMRSRSWAV
jgi:hypothetical protein